jgi:hypothetical protein
LAAVWMRRMKIVGMAATLYPHDPNKRHRELTIRAVVRFLQ